MPWKFPIVTHFCFVEFTPIFLTISVKNTYNFEKLQFSYRSLKVIPLTIFSNFSWLGYTVNHELSTKFRFFICNFFNVFFLWSDWLFCEAVMWFLSRFCLFRLFPCNFLANVNCWFCACVPCRYLFCSKSHLTSFLILIYTYIEDFLASFCRSARNPCTLLRMG